MTELFRNTHGALTFAYNYSSQQYALSPVSKLMKTGIGSDIAAKASPVNALQSLFTLSWPAVDPVTGYGISFACLRKPYAGRST
jgi:hypothetical protein